MRKKLQAACIVVGMSILLTGCAFQETSSEQETYGKENNVVDINSTTEGDTENAIASSSAFPNIPEFSGELDFDYVYGTDAQSEIGDYVTCAYTADGKYYMKPTNEYNDNNILYYYDYATDQTVPVCSKSNCEHNEEKCDAFFSGEQYFNVPSFWYYEDSLYIPMKEDDYLYFEKISPDGSTREKTGVILRWEDKVTVNLDGTESVDMTFPVGQLHRGYMYFTNYSLGDKNVKLYRSELGSSDNAEVIFSLEGNNPGMFNIKPYGRYVLFQMCNFSDDYLDYKGGTYAYDTENGSISLIAEDMMGNYIIIENRMYYNDQKNCIYCKDLKSGEVSMLFDGLELEKGYATTLFAKDGGFVYQIDNNLGEISEQIVFDLEGKEQERLDLEVGEGEVEAFEPYSFVAKE